MATPGPPEGSSPRMLSTLTRLCPEGYSAGTPTYTPSSPFWHLPPHTSQPVPVMLHRVPAKKHLDQLPCAGLSCVSLHTPSTPTRWHWVQAAVVGQEHRQAQLAGPHTAGPSRLISLLLLPASKARGISPSLQKVRGGESDISVPISSPLHPPTPQGCPTEEEGSSVPQP